MYLTTVSKSEIIFINLIEIIYHLIYTYSIRYCAWQKCMHGTLLAPWFP